MPRLRHIIVLILLPFATEAAADIFKWQDQDGNVHFGDRPPATARPRRVEVKVNTYKSVEEGYSPDWFYKGKNSVGRQQVVIYSAAWCGVCDRAKQYFKDNGIAYKELDIDKSTAGREGYKKLNGKGVPIILVGKRRMNGFNPERFDKMYHSKAP